MQYHFFQTETGKSLAQEVRQKRDILDRRSKELSLQHVQLGHCATCPGSSYTKSEYNLLYQKFDAEYFFIQQFFSKKAVFSEKTAKNFFGGAFDNFFGEEDVLYQKLT